jgi:hypothetical protein
LKGPWDFLIECKKHWDMAITRGRLYKASFACKSQIYNVCTYRCIGRHLRCTFNREAQHFTLPSPDGQVYLCTYVLHHFAMTTK